VVFRETLPGSGVFDSLAQVFTPNYLDTGLVNGDEYCYYTLAKGRYTADTLNTILRNRSQRACGTPLDTNRPCAPILTADFNCTSNELRLDWATTDPSCPDDVAFYNLYFKPTIDDDFPSTPLVTGITSEFFDNFDGVVIGCYAVTAVDDASNDPGGIPNESDLSNIVCLEGCPNLELPNVFTPNGDNLNDFFSVVRDANGVPLINNIGTFQLRVFNRWGEMVYETSNLDEFINRGWDGTDATSGADVADGVYFYVCTYVPISVRNSPERELNGTVHLFR
jgi:gliding motility-associated-like protein